MKSHWYSCVWENAGACKIPYSLLCALHEETSVLYLVSKCQLTLTLERRVGWCPELFTRGFARKFSRRVVSWRKLTEIGLEIPGEGRVNFRHLVVSSARHQKSYLQQKSNRLERTTEETRCIIKNRHAIWIASHMWIVCHTDVKLFPLFFSIEVTVRLQILFVWKRAPVSLTPRKHTNDLGRVQEELLSVRMCRYSKTK